MAASPVATPSVGKGQAAAAPTPAPALPLAPPIVSSTEVPQGESWFVPLLRTGLTILGHLWLVCGVVAFLATTVVLIYLFGSRRQAA